MNSCDRRYRWLVNRRCSMHSDINGSSEAWQPDTPAWENNTYAPPRKIDPEPHSWSYDAYMCFSKKALRLRLNSVEAPHVTVFTIPRLRCRISERWRLIRNVWECCCFVVMNISPVVHIYWRWSLRLEDDIVCAMISRVLWPRHWRQSRETQLRNIVYAFHSPILLLYLHCRIELMFPLGLPSAAHLGVNLRRSNFVTLCEQLFSTSGWFVRPV